jgi:hypothetical protein
MVELNQRVNVSSIIREVSHYDVLNFLVSHLIVSELYGLHLHRLLSVWVSLDTRRLQKLKERSVFFLGTDLLEHLVLFYFFELTVEAIEVCIAF